MQIEERDGWSSLCLVLVLLNSQKCFLIRRAHLVLFWEWGNVGIMLGFLKNRFLQVLLGFDSVTFLRKPTHWEN